jgi:hypothetical protein
MILTVTLNAAIDRTLAVPNFRLGRRHRAVEQTAIAGGKGVNVARALKALGRPVLAAGAVGGGAGARIIEMLDDEGIANDFVRINDESRMSTAVIDPPRSTSAGRPFRRQSASAPSSASSTWRRAPRSACSAAACRAACRSSCTGSWSRSCTSSA